MDRQNPEQKYSIPTMLFGYAISTPIDEVVNLPNEHHLPMNQVVSNHLSEKLYFSDKRFSGTTAHNRLEAQGLLSAGIHDLGRIVVPYLPVDDRERAHAIARHDDTPRTIALLALNNEYRLREINAQNIRSHAWFGVLLEDRGITTQPTYYPDSTGGCPFAGSWKNGEEPVPARPLFTKFCRWAIDLTLADLDRKKYFKS